MLKKILGNSNTIPVMHLSCVEAMLSVTLKIGDKSDNLNPFNPKMPETFVLFVDLFIMLWSFICFLCLF